MPTIKHIGLAFAIYLPTCLVMASAALATERPALQEECGAFSQAGMRDCLAQKAQDSQKALQEAQRDAMHIISQWDEEGKFIAQAKTKLMRANRAFVKYRDAQCAFNAALGGGAIGNALEMRRLTCVAELNVRHVEHLRAILTESRLK